MEAIIKHIREKSRFLVASHANPDGDAIGSLLAMGLALEDLDKNVVLYNESSIPAVYRFLPEVSRVKRQLPTGDSFDCAIILDCGDIERVGELVPVIEQIPVIINIDHHITNIGFGHDQIIDTDACATAEIVYHLLKKLNVKITPPMAAAIYTGILTDTGSFRFSNTNQAAFTICEEMVRTGVDPYRIAQKVYGTYSLGRIKLLNLALDSIEISDNGKLSMMTLTREMKSETGTNPQDVDGLINYAKNIQDVKVAILIHEQGQEKKASNSKKRYHISLRSDGTIDVARIAASFGGGGHCSAAGFNSDMLLPVLKSKLIELAEFF